MYQKFSLNWLVAILFPLAAILWSCQNEPSRKMNEKKETRTEQTKPPSDSHLVFVGTYTRKESFVNGKAKGIYVYEMDKKTGALKFVNQSPPTVNPTYLVVHPNGKYLYAVNEVGGDAANPTGSVSAFSIDPVSKELKPLNSVSSHGVAPCYISLEQSGKYVLVANYVSGTVAMFPVLEDGTLGEAASVVQHRGKGPHPRQEGPHAHFIRNGPDNRFAYAADLGLDKIMIYKMDLTKGQLIPAEPNAFAKTEAAAGPRQLAFHPNKHWVYEINELNGTIEAFQIDGATGALHHFQTIRATEKRKGSDLGSADIHITPSGKFLYASSRGDENNIAMYSIDNQSGKLSLIGFQSTLGKAPRNFAIDPSGTFLLVANQDTDNVVTFRIDPRSGKLMATGLQTKILTPVCLKFW